jgi:hypothetical protein
MLQMAVMDILSDHQSWIKNIVRSVLHAIIDGFN